MLEQLVEVAHRFECEIIGSTRTVLQDSPKDGEAV